MGPWAQTKGRLLQRSSNLDRDMHKHLISVDLVLEPCAGALQEGLGQALRAGICPTCVFRPQLALRVDAQLRRSESHLRIQESCALVHVAQHQGSFHVKADHCFDIHPAVLGQPEGQYVDTRLPGHSRGRQAAMDHRVDKPGPIHMHLELRVMGNLRERRKFILTVARATLGELGETDRRGPRPMQVPSTRLITVGSASQLACR
jgi:hypothetical protein